jgi:hypothetical protein
MSFKLILAFAVAATFVTACSPSSSSMQQLLDQGCDVNTPDPRACDPADTHKTTICHIPPGNPANAHTICVGNASVPAHLDHGDFAGTCSCTGDAGVPGTDDGGTPGLDGGVSTDVDAGADVDAGTADGGVVL